MVTPPPCLPSVEKLNFDFLIFASMLSLELDGTESWADMVDDYPVTHAHSVDALVADDADDSTLTQQQLLPNVCGGTQQQNQQPQQQEIQQQQQQEIQQQQQQQQQQNQQPMYYQNSQSPQYYALPPGPQSEIRRILSYSTLQRHVFSPSGATNLPSNAHIRAQSFNDLIRLFAESRWNDIPIEQRHTSPLSSTGFKRRREPEDMDRDQDEHSSKRARRISGQENDQASPSVSSNSNTGDLRRRVAPLRQRGVGAHRYLSDKRRSLVALYDEKLLALQRDLTSLYAIARSYPHAQMPISTAMEIRSAEFNWSRIFAKKSALVGEECATASLPPPPGAIDNRSDRLNFAGSAAPGLPPPPPPPPPNEVATELSPPALPIKVPKTVLEEESSLHLESDNNVKI
ncbi:MAG: hypothetical protein SGCHY_005592 [Lobulomycetales sp.]